jgi:GNAT superfamily N-acetyltransferase
MPESPTSPIIYLICPPVDNAALNALFAAAWPAHTHRDFAPVLARSLLYIGGYSGANLIGFVNVATDGGLHAFLLDTTVYPTCQHQGIGSHLVTLAAEEARHRGAHWLHVDFEPHLAPFYRACGFIPTEAGLLRLGISQHSDV